MTGEEKFFTPEEDGAALLGDVHAFLGRFVAYPSTHAHVAHVLWIAHTHLMPAWESTPRIAFLSPEPGSGKTRALEVSELLVPRPVEAINATPAYIFRKVSAPEGPPTILYDEIDTLFGPKAKDNEEIRGVLNAGHRRGAVAGRCVVKGKIIETEELQAYCAVALAGLGDLPDTLLSRSVVVRMRRRAPGEHVDPFRRRLEVERGADLRERLSRWCDTIRDGVTDAYPAMPDGIEDRNADVWEALLSVAEAAGGDWPDRSRVAALYLVAEAKASTPSLGVRLLADLRVIFGDHKAMSTEDILAALNGLEESPWNDLHGKPLNARGLANRLRPYGVHSTKVRIDATTVLQGFRREDLHDAWNRYLAPVPDVPDAMAGTPPQKSSSRDPHALGVGVPHYGSGTSGTSGTNGAGGETPPRCATCGMRSIRTEPGEPQCRCDEPLGPSKGLVGILFDALQDGSMSPDTDPGDDSPDVRAAWVEALRLHRETLAGVPVVAIEECGGVVRDAAADLMNAARGAEWGGGER